MRCDAFNVLYCTIHARYFQVEKWLHNAGSQMTVLFAVGGDVSTKELLTAFKGLAEQMHGQYLWGICISSACLNRYGSNMPPLFGENNPAWGNASVAVHFPKRTMVTNLEPKFRFWSYPLTLLVTQNDMLTHWLDGVVPLAGELKHHTYARYARTGLPLFLLYVEIDWENNAKQAQYYLNRLRLLAHEAQGTMVFALADKRTFHDDLAQFGLSHTTPGELWTIRSDDTKKFASPPGAHFSMEAAQKFIKSFKENGLTHFTRSAPVPASLDGSHVVPIVRSNFDQWISDPRKGVMICFYAPWCPHSQAFLKVLLVHLFNALASANSR